MTVTTSSNMETWEKLDKAVSALKYCLKTIGETGKKLAEAEMEYKVALSKKVFELKEKKVPATIISLTIYGQEEIAKLRYQRDVAKSIYKANLEAINVYKLETKILSAQMEKEYYNEEIS